MDMIHQMEGCMWHQTEGRMQQMEARMVQLQRLSAQVETFSTRQLALRVKVYNILESNLLEDSTS
jgi:hypothetical protein